MDGQLVGNDGGWVRVASAQLRPDRSGKLNVSAIPSAQPFGISLMGEFSDVDASLIEFGTTTLTIKGETSRMQRLRAAK